jgi:hypothetical protein
MEKLLVLSIDPDVERYSNRTEEIKNMIQSVIDIALIDFMMVSSVFKKYNQFAEPSMSDDDAKRVSYSVRALQYMDTFSQKLDHIIKLNQEILRTEKRGKNDRAEKIDHAGFIFKLNHLQATVAADEFLSNATSLKQNMHELHDHIISVTKLDFHESAYFRHLNEIDEKLEKLKSILHEIQVERYQEAPQAIALIEDEMRNISNLYTMTSERFVLLWLLKHSHASSEELLRQYKQDGYEQVEEEIDLF